MRQFNTHVFHNQGSLMNNFPSSTYTLNDKHLVKPLNLLPEIFAPIYIKYLLSVVTTDKSIFLNILFFFIEDFLTLTL